jgi:cytochrome c553
MTPLHASKMPCSPLRQATLSALRYGALLMTLAPATGLASTEAGRQIASTACAQCHGLDGNSVEPTYPKLAGQTAAYTAKQISEFIMGTRSHEPAPPAVSQMTPLEAEALAAYFSQQKTSPGKPGEPTLNEIGKLLYTIGNPKTGLPSCDGCHSADATGGGRFPRLAGQHRDYLVKQLNDIRAGRRNSSTLMRAVADRMGELEIRAMAIYLSGL